MAVNVAPERADAVEVAPALDVEQIDPLGALDDQGLRCHPVRHRRERVPEMGVVPVSQSSGRWGVHIDDIQRIDPQMTQMDAD
jgi:hypothetical protein